jgi:hypothetical protein
VGLDRSGLGVAAFRPRGAASFAAAKIGCVQMSDPTDAARAHMAKFEALAEQAYDDMYESRSPRICYSNLKDYFVDAIAAAERAGLPAEAKRLQDRLRHCVKVYRSQFAGFDR